MSRGSAAPSPDEQLENNAGESGFVYVRTPTGSEQEGGRPSHRRAPKHVREVSRQMQGLQEEVRQQNLQQALQQVATHSMLAQKASQEEFTELADRVRDMTLMLHEISIRLEGKADADEVVRVNVSTAERLQQLEAAVAKQALADQVPTEAAFKQLRHDVSMKAVAGEVPTSEAFLELRYEVMAKAPVDQVPTNEDVRQLRDDIFMKALELRNEVMATASIMDQAPSNDEFQRLRDDFFMRAAEDQAALRQLQDEVMAKANLESVPTNEAFWQLWNEVLAKATMDQVPSNEEFQQLRDELFMRATEAQVLLQRPVLTQRCIFAISGNGLLAYKNTCRVRWNLDPPVDSGLIVVEPDGAHLQIVEEGMYKVEILSPRGGPFIAVNDLRMFGDTTCGIIKLDAHSRISVNVPNVVSGLTYIHLVFTRLS